MKGLNNLRNFRFLHFTTQNYLKLDLIDFLNTNKMLNISYYLKICGCLQIIVKFKYLITADENSCTFSRLHFQSF
jgi:hypothetical protein